MGKGLQIFNKICRPLFMGTFREYLAIAPERLATRPEKPA